MQQGVPAVMMQCVPYYIRPFCIGLGLQTKKARLITGLSRFNPCCIGFNPQESGQAQGPAPTNPMRRGDPPWSP